MVIPQTGSTTSLLAGVLVGVCIELLLAANGAKVIGLSVVFTLPSSLGRIDLHPADVVAFHVELPAKTPVLQLSPHSWRDGLRNVHTPEGCVDQEKAERLRTIPQQP